MTREITRQFEVMQYVTGFMPGEIQDWPANIQDEVYKALERKSHQERRDLKIVRSYCDKEVDEQLYYVHVIAICMETVS